MQDQLLSVHTVHLTTVNFVYSMQDQLLPLYIEFELNILRLFTWLSVGFRFKSPGFEWLASYQYCHELTFLPGYAIILFHIERARD